MSLDVYLRVETPISKKGTGVFIRENGANRELTIGEVREKYPDAIISENEIESNCVYDANITHNLGTMASNAGIYEALWRPHRLKEGYNIPENDYVAECKFEAEAVTFAKDIIPILEKGLADLKARPEYFSQFNSSNGWGVYEHFVPFVEEYLKACKEYPNAIVETSR